MATYFNPLLLFVFALVLIGTVVFLRKRKGESLAYLLFFAVFFSYLFKVLDFTLLQFQTLLLLKFFVPNLILNGQMAGEELNLVPLMSLTSSDMVTSLLNVLLFVPFGFGLPFITDLRFWKVALAGMATSILIELLQFISGHLAGTAFRVADINDVIFNTAGTVVGYCLFVGFLNIYRRMLRDSDKAKYELLRYISDRPQVGTR